MDNLETEEKKKESDITRKILVAIMVMLLVVIVIILILLYNIKANTFTISIDGKALSNTENFLKTIDDTTYVNIQDLATSLDYEYHVGEYKVFSSDEDKCYIQSTNETASFYLNSNKVCKLKIGEEITEDYDVFTCKSNIIELDNKFYAPIDAIQIGFNVIVNLTEKSMNITTLNTLLNTVEDKLNTDKNNLVYDSILEEEFDNQKAVLYGYVISSKKNSDLYSVSTFNGQKIEQEIIPDKYKNITFLESTKEFLVTNSLDKMGIIDPNGQNKIEQLYDSIKVIGNDPKLYLVELNQKYGVIDEYGNTIVYTEYDSIGADINKYTDLQNQYVLFDSMIPVCKDNKYGLFDTKGNKVLDLKYDGIGCDLESIEIEGTTKSVTPVATIEDCEGIIIKNGEVYDLFLVEDKKLVSLKVSSVYYVRDNGEIIYYMIYKGKELNLIERLVEAGVINNTQTENEEIEPNSTISNTIKDNVSEDLKINQTAQQFNETLE